VSPHRYRPVALRLLLLRHRAVDRLDEGLGVSAVLEASKRPIVAEVFADIKASRKIDFVPTIRRTLATHPEHLRLCWTRLNASVLKFWTVVEQ
jgi:hypothetical protein